MKTNSIPARLIIGVTGHRIIDGQAALRVQIQSAIQQVKQLLPSLPHSPLNLTVLSPLADGADRLVVQEILNMPETTLEVVLPMAKNDYTNDFSSDESRREFEQLLLQANNLKVLPQTTSRNEAYEQVGRYIVDQCDVLFALWDGTVTGGRGGTGEIVNYARETNCPLIWIHLEGSGGVTFEAGRGLNIKAFQYLEEYNSEKVNDKDFGMQFDRVYSSTIGDVARYELPTDKFSKTADYNLRNYLKADILTVHYQKLYYRTEYSIYGLALIATVIGALQIFFPQPLFIIGLIEIFLMLAALLLVFVSRRVKWHNKWIDYRFLAERFRSAMFMTLVNLEISTLRPPRHLSLAYSPKDWIVLAYLSFWVHRPSFDHSAFASFTHVRSFISDAWIQNQINYHLKLKKRNSSKHKLVSGISYAIFSLTIIIIFLQIINPGDNLIDTSFAFMAIVLPATGAVVTAIKFQRDYLLNSIRSGEMAGHLVEFKGRIDTTSSYNDFLMHVRDMEETMLHENQYWRMAVKFQSPELPT